jgi:mono/diheme cytochrome c family protein
MTDQPSKRFSIRAWMQSGVFALLAAGLLAAGCARGDSGQSNVKTTAFPETPADLKAGETLFNADCSGCHGLHATGSDSGPPLVDRIYEPNHHADASFALAVRRGVRSHHWGFGDMPPIPGIKDEEINRIVAYVRWLQKQAGIK